MPIPRKWDVDNNPNLSKTQGYRASLVGIRRDKSDSLFNHQEQSSETRKSNEKDKPHSNMHVSRNVIA